MPLKSETTTIIFNEARQLIVGMHNATPDSVWRNVLTSLTDDQKEEIAEEIGADELTADSLKQAFKDVNKFVELKRFNIDIIERTKLLKGAAVASMLEKLIKKTYFRVLSEVDQDTSRLNFIALLDGLLENLRPVDTQWELGYLSSKRNGGDKFEDFVTYVLPDYFTHEEKELYNDLKAKIMDDPFALRSSPYEVSP